MKNVVILKLGGSIITKKSGGAVIRVKLIEQIAKELRRIYTREKGKIGLILLHGAGSFGHPLAKQYRLKKRPLSENCLIGASRTINSIRKLGTKIAEIFLKESLPIFPIQTSSLVEKSKDELKFKDNFSLITRILENNGIPLLGGDAVLVDHKYTDAASADHLAVSLAKHFKVRKICFATDVDGVYKNFPPKKNEKNIPFIKIRELKELAKIQPVVSNKIDVTGEMFGKLKSLLKLRGCSIEIFDGRKIGNYKNSLLKIKPVGTIIEI